MSLLTSIKSLFGFGGGKPKLQSGDRLLPCEDCNKEFVFDAGEQRFFKSKGFTDPKRCPHCRKNVKVKIRKKKRSFSRGNQRNRYRRRSSARSNSPYADEY